MNNTTNPSSPRTNTSNPTTSMSDTENTGSTETESQTIETENNNNTETIPAYLPGEYELVKEILEDGSKLIRHPYNTLSKVETYNIDLYSVVHTWLSRFQDLVNLLDDESYGGFGHLFETVVQITMLELEEINDHIEKSVGLINVERVISRNSFFRRDRVVGVSVE